jgi:hypothetical protein
LDEDETARKPIGNTSDPRPLQDVANGSSLRPDMDDLAVVTALQEMSSSPHRMMAKPVSSRCFDLNNQRVRDSLSRIARPAAFGPPSVCRSVVQQRTGRARARIQPSPHLLRGGGRDIALAAYDLPVSRRYRVRLPDGVTSEGAGETLWWFVRHRGSGLPMTLAAADR